MDPMNSRDVLPKNVPGVGWGWGRSCSGGLGWVGHAGGGVGWMGHAGVGWVM